MDWLIQDIADKWQALSSLLAFDTARLSEPDMVIRLLLQVLLLLGSAYFSSSETALFSLSRLDLQQLRRERNKHSEALHALLDQPRRLIISILSGNELVNIAASANMAAILVNLYSDGQAGWVNLLVMVPLLLLFGEVTPKTIAVANPVRFSTRIVAEPMSVWVKIITPLRWAIRGISDRITTLIVGEEKAAENILQIDEFLTLVEQVAREGALDATERALIYNLLEASDTEIVEIMTPRTRTQFLNVDMTVVEMVDQFKTYRHPRVPVFRTLRDNLVGFVHAEDIVRLVMDKEDLTRLTPEDIMHPPVVVPLTKKVDEMFDFFKDNRVRAAACLNEFGGVEGFITMKDVLKFIFGQISGDVKGDEYYQEKDDNTYEVSGDMKLNDFNNLTNFGIEDPRMTTIGGVAFRHLDRLPKVGDRVTIEGITICIVDMDMHRISRVQVMPAAATEEEDDTVDELEAAPIDDGETEEGQYTEQVNNTEETTATEDAPVGKAATVTEEATIDMTAKSDLAEAAAIKPVDEVVPEDASEPSKAPTSQEETKT